MPVPLIIPIVSESIIELARTERSIAMPFGSRDSSRPAAASPNNVLVPKDSGS